MKVIVLNKNLSSTNEFMGDRYLEVDGTITPIWSDFFEQSHANSWHNMKRSVRIEGRFIVVNCPLDELQSQINQIQSHCAQADHDLAALEVNQLAEQQQKQQASDDAANKAKTVFDNLKF